MTKPSFIAGIDDFLLDNLQAIVAKIHVRTGADKETLIRNVHAGSALFCLAWSIGAYPFDTLFALLPGFNMISEAMDAVTHHRKIGNAETAKGYESAVREASDERLRGRIFRMLYLATFAMSAVVFLGIFSSMAHRTEAPSVDHAFMATFGIGLLGWQAGYAISKFLKAVLPPHPGTRKAYEHIGRMVTE